MISFLLGVPYDSNTDSFPDQPSGVVNSQYGDFDEFYSCAASISLDAVAEKRMITPRDLLVRRHTRIAVHGITRVKRAEGDNQLPRQNKSDNIWAWTLLVKRHRLGET